MTTCATHPCGLPPCISTNLYISYLHQLRNHERNVKHQRNFECLLKRIQKHPIFIVGPQYKQKSPKYLETTAREIGFAVWAVSAVFCFGPRRPSEPLRQSNHNSSLGPPLCMAAIRSTPTGRQKKQCCLVYVCVFVGVQQLWRKTDLSGKKFKKVHKEMQGRMTNKMGECKSCI